MKKNYWGFGIVSVFVLFVVFMVGMVVKAHMHDVDLVSDDYYAKEIKFQDHIDEAENGSQFRDSVQLTLSADTVTLKMSIPHKIEGGEVAFFNPSDPKKDKEMQLKLDNNQCQYFDRSKFQTGHYKAQLSWQAEGKKYFVEKDLTLE